MGSQWNAVRTKPIILTTHLYNKFENTKNENRPKYKVNQQLNSKGESIKKVTEKLKDITKVSKNKGKIRYQSHTVTPSPRPLGALSK